MNHSLIGCVKTALLSYIYLIISNFSIKTSAAELPPIINYSSTIYRAHDQNWGIELNGRQIMYSANSDGLLEYDGANWRLYPFPNGQIVRSVLCDSSDGGRVYSGGFGEFGYWENTSTGKMVYHSISKFLKMKSIQTEEIWHILKTPEAIYFQSFSYIFRYDGHSVREIRAPGNFMYLRYVNGKLLIQLIKKGLYELQGNRFKLLKGTELLHGSNVSSILPIDKEKLLIATEKNGIFLWEEGQLVHWNISVTGELKKNILNKVIRLRNGNYALGTILKGVYIISPDGKLIDHFDIQNGLQNNTVLGLYEDARQNLWLALDKGIDLIRLASPVTSYSLPKNSLGTIYAAAVWKEQLYIGSNNGLFVKKWLSKEPFRLVSGLQGQVWDLKVIDNQLICGHNDGTYRIDDTGVSRISPAAGGWVILPVTIKGKQLLLQGTYSGIHVFKKDESGLWQYAYPIQGMPPIPVREIVQDNDGYFWISHAYKGLYRLKLDESLTKISEWREFKSPEDLPSEYVVEITNWKGHLLIRSGTHFFRPGKNGNLVEDKEFSGASNEPFKIRQGIAGEWFKVFRDRTYLYKVSGESRSFAVSLVRNAERIVAVTPDYYLFCLGNGYELFNRLQKGHFREEQLAPLIRSISSLTNTTITFPVVSNLKLPPNERALRVNFSLPVYGSEVWYQYRLSGVTKKWSDPTLQSYADFTNLSAGKYHFQVKSSFNSKVTVYDFEILPRWYETLWAQILFVAIGGLILTVTIHLQEKRLVRHQQRILKEHDEKLRQQQLEAERRIVQINNENLQNQVKNKSQQLSNIAINVVRKNEILEEIRDQLKQVKEEMGHELRTIHYNRLMGSIERNVSGKEDWKLFEDNFDEIHEEFFKHIKRICPLVSPSELRLAACLRMNLSTKEMAPALGISVRGVEIKRYRLRKKLGLDNETNLIEYMMNIC